MADVTLYLNDNMMVLPTLGKQSIDIIYIDPPYNTKQKSKFGYSDNQQSHNWYSNMEKVITELHRILNKNGCIFISIDDNELITLRTLMDKIFGKNNFLGVFITRQATRSNSKHINTIHEYVVAYAKNKKYCPDFKIKRIDSEYGQDLLKLINNVKQLHFNGVQKDDIKLYLKQNINKLIQNNGDCFNFLKNYSHIDEYGDIFSTSDASLPSVRNNSNGYIINRPDLNLFLDLPKLENRHWLSEDKIIELHLNNALAIINDRPYKKNYLKDSYDYVGSVLNFYSRNGTHDLRNDIGYLANHFITPKPINLIKYLLQLAKHHYDTINYNPVILDCFAGSGTTAIASHQVYPNSECILIQNNEPCVNPNKEIQFISQICELRLKNHNITYKVI